ncbi:MFS transporter [Oceanirhabdus seepicola]|uniref:MFS transporter n=1 Tax=Oceanirhabdus seepicola TaxID=2828781 RepID=A0A9J6P3X9_9CLOT|nr:MFS transporter [Oceanirhabdus seepicola]MCM1991482.1 MFS transporter [Oceanirhabdus seepicola]
MEANVLRNNSIDKKLNNVVNINIVIMLMGRLVSLFGSNIYSFAMSMYILSKTGSSMSFSINLVLVILPQVLFAPISGVIADKVDKKKMIVSMDILSGIVILILFGVSMINGLQISYIYTATFLLAICTVFFDTPMTAAIPSLINKEKLTKINSWNEAVSSITRISGPFIGGIVFALIDIRLFLLVNGVSFILSGISEIFLNFNVEEMINEECFNEDSINEEVHQENSFNEVDESKGNNKQEEKKSVKSTLIEYWVNFLEGIKYLKREKWLGTFMTYIIAINFLCGMGIGVPGNYIMMNVIGFDPKVIGIINMAFPAAALVTAMIISLLPEAKSVYRKLIFGLCVTSVCVISMGVLIIPEFLQLSMTGYFIIFITIYSAASIATTTFNIPINVTLQKMIPADKRGRIFGVIGMLATVAMPVAFLLSGIMMEYLPVFITPITAGTIMFILTVSMSRKKEIKKM